MASESRVVAPRWGMNIGGRRTLGLLAVGLGLLLMLPGLLATAGTVLVMAGVLARGLGEAALSLASWAVGGWMGLGLILGIPGLLLFVVGLARLR
jgi:hypothetical protein